MTSDEIEQLLRDHFPAAVGFAKITRVEGDALDLIVPYKPEYLRPGGTLSGPTLFTAADTALYFLILSKLGPFALAVTTQMSINFLKKPPAKDLLASAKLLKLGRGLVVGEVSLFDAEKTLVAHAVGTYSLPRSDR